MRKFLLSQGFTVETLSLLNRENIQKLAAEYGYKK